MLLSQIIPSKLKKLIRKKIMLGDFYFSQSGEDLILKSFFNNKLHSKNQGFYVDVGAYHPTMYSNTYFFYLNGWRGINIEPRPGSKILFDKKRPNDINIEVGVSIKEAQLKYYYIDNKSPMNSFSSAFLEQNNTKQLVKKEILIETKRLDNILGHYLPAEAKIDFMNVDAEGLDIEVLSSNNWEKYRPKVLIVELFAKSFEQIINTDISKYLASINYKPLDRAITSSGLGSVFYYDELLGYENLFIENKYYKH